MKKRSPSPKKRGEEESRLAGGAIGGAILGGSVGGPPGAVIGGMIGLLLADSVNEDKKKSKKPSPKKSKNMADKKVVFIAFAIEDERSRDFLKGQSLHTESPFEFIDMSVKEAYDRDWKEKVLTRIRRSDGMIVLVSKNSLNSSGQKWEISCAQAENKPIFAMWIYTDDRTNLPGLSAVPWTWPAIQGFIDSL